MHLVLNLFIDWLAWLQEKHTFIYLQPANFPSVSLCSSSGCCWVCKGPPARGSAPAATDLRARETAEQRKRQGERWKEGAGQPLLPLHSGAADTDFGQRNAGQALCHLQWSRCVISHKRLGNGAHINLLEDASKLKWEIFFSFLFIVNFAALFVL